MVIDRSRRRLRLRELEILVEVVNAGSMRKATQTIHLSEPAVSKAVRQLEDALGLPLLERGRRGVAPTVYGESLVRRSQAVFDELNGALRELAHLADPASGEVRLGCMETLHAGLVSATVQRVLRQHPRMRFVLESGQSPDLIAHFLQKRRVEFVVVRPLSLPLPAEVDGEPLFRDRLRVVVGLKSPFAKRRRINLAELMDEHWILSRNEVMDESPVAQSFAALGLAMPRRFIVSGSLNARYNLLDTGSFVTVVPHSLLPFVRHRSDFRILPIQLPVWQTHTMILTLRGRTIGPAAELFLAELRKLALPLDIEPEVAAPCEVHIPPAKG